MQKDDFINICSLAHLFAFSWFLQYLSKFIIIILSGIQKSEDVTQYRTAFL